MSTIPKKVQDFLKKLLETQKKLEEKIKNPNALPLDEMLNRMAVVGSSETIKNLANELSITASNVAITNTTKLRIYLNSIVTICALAEEAIQRLETIQNKTDSTIEQEKRSKSN